MDDENLPQPESNDKLENWKQWTPKEFLVVLLPELQTPVTVIAGYVQILSDETKREFHPQAVKSIQKSVETLLALCNDIADYNRIED